MNIALLAKVISSVVALILLASNVFPKQNVEPEVKSVAIQVTPSPTVSLTPSPIPDPNITIVKVTNVIDGDTFTIEGGAVIRMIGIDTPETVHPSKPVQCFGKEASNKTKELLEGKEVILEKDVSETDKYNRLLRYVYIGDVFINEYLVRDGYAKSSSYPPDIKYQDKFIEAQRKAQEESKGLWNVSACPTATPKPIVTARPSTPKPVSNTTNYAPATTTQTVNNTGGAYTCNCSKTCPNMSCSEAQYQLNTCGCGARDADDDGIACDSQCQ